MKLQYFLAILFIAFIQQINAVQITPGINNYAMYAKRIKHQRVAIIANSASITLDKQNSIDFLLNKQVAIVKIFSPEHGFSGKEEAGGHVGNSRYKNSNIPIISLYDNNLKLQDSDLQNVDIIIFDIQDVGVRFYTYISTLQYVMEAAANNNKTLIIMDRPNPNSFYIDGPVLESSYKSFVGMQSIPIVYGMTIGEYAMMLTGEKWLETKNNLNLIIIPIKNYKHSDKYKLPANPSPNLSTMQAIYLYPSLGLFEGTQTSIGRGTALPFSIYGYPNYPSSFEFTPKYTTIAKTPPFENQLCTGVSLSTQNINKQINLSYLQDAYDKTPAPESFFTAFFKKLAGNTKLQQQIINHVSESEIRQSWESDIQNFKQIRNNYLIYPES